MRIITHTCEECGTVIAANELESNQVMKCSGINCDNVLRFDDLDKEEQKYFLKHRDRYEL